MVALLEDRTTLLRAPVQRLASASGCKRGRAKWEQRLDARGERKHALVFESSRARYS
jgi:hypothetical protein